MANFTGLGDKVRRAPLVWEKFRFWPKKHHNMYVIGDTARSTLLFESMQTKITSKNFLLGNDFY